MRKYSVCWSAFALIAGFSTVMAQAAEAKKETQIVQKEQPFTVKLGSTRVIYNPDSSGAVLAVSNPQDYPMLVKSSVFDADKKTEAPFIVTPPLFRLDGQQQSRLRIVRTGGNFPGDRESMNWLCVTGIPPKKDDTWAEGAKPKPEGATLNVQISIDSCIKLLVRPSSLRGDPANVAGSLTWQRQGSALHVNNPTPFFMNMKSVSLGGHAIANPEFIPPFGDKTYPLPAGVSAGDVEWKVITDYGGDSRAYTTVMK